MRQTLIRIFLDEPWALWKTDPATGISGPGIALLWCLGGAILFGAPYVARAVGRSLHDREGWPLGEMAAWLIGLVALTFNGWLIRLIDSIKQNVAGPDATATTSLPVFGYGFMLLVGFLSAIWFARRRAMTQRIDPNTIWDAGFWMLIAGVVGARGVYLVEYGDRVFAGKQGLQVLFAAINLSGGGLVLIGGLAGGAIGYLAFCRSRRISALALADIITPSVFIGIGFGRIGCLLNGCCFGDSCDLPWAIHFPRGSVTFDVLWERGFLSPDALMTMGLHPTQVYSAIDGFLLAYVTASVFPFRRYRGDVLVVGCVLYSITRFLIEFLRGDEMGQFGTSLTYSQHYCLWIFGGAILTAIFQRLTGHRVNPLPTPA